MAHTPFKRVLIRILQQAQRNNQQETGTRSPRPHAQLNTARRQFLKTAGAAGVIGMVPGLFSKLSFASGDSSPSIAIIGGGLAGLNAAYQLKKLGVYAQVYEASNRLGGRVLSRTGVVEPGITVELGGELINSDHADLLALVEEFGLTLFNRHIDAASIAVVPDAYYFDGKSWPEAELAALLQPLAAQISLDADLLEQDWERYAAKFDRQSVTAYLDRHAALIPQPFIRTLIENTIRTEYGADPTESSALQLLFLLPVVDGNEVELLGYSDEAYTIEGGNGRVIEGLAQALRGNTHLGMALSKLEKDHKEGYRLHFTNGAQVDAEYVILALPFTVLRRIELDVSLPRKLRQFINEADLGSNEKILAGYRQRLWRQADGFALGAWTDLGFSEVWDGSQRQTDRQEGVLTYYLGGHEVDDASATRGGSDVVGNNFTQGLTRFIPHLATTATGNYVGTRWTRNPFSLGAYASFKPGQLTRFARYFWVESDLPSEVQEVNVGRLIFVGEQVSDAYYGFMNGAAQTGRLAAGVIVAALAKSSLAGNEKSIGTVG